MLWIRRGAIFQVAEAETLNKFYVDFGMQPLKHSPAITIGTRFTLGVLLLGALATIWFTHPGQTPANAPHRPAAAVAPASPSPR